MTLPKRECWLLKRLALGFGVAAGFKDAEYH